MERKLQEQKEATELRLKGMSYIQIAKKLGVSKSSLSRWLHSIPYKNKEFNFENASDAFKNRWYILKLEKEKRIRSIKKESIGEIGKLTKRDLIIGGAVLYWAEGTKVGEEVCISNSDPAVIQFAMNWFREICKVNEEKFRIQLHLHSDLNHNICQHYWMRITGIPKKQFHKSYIKESSLGHRKNRLYKGTVKIRVNDRNLHRRIMGWIQGLVL